MQRLTHTRGDSLLERGSKHTQTHTPCMAATVTLNRSESGRGRVGRCHMVACEHPSHMCLHTPTALLTGIVSANVAHAHAHPSTPYYTVLLPLALTLGRLVRLGVGVGGRSDR